jgi:hypothetical protein
MQATVLVHLKCYQGVIVRSNKNVTEGTMSDDDKMTIDERRKYLRMVKKGNYSSQPEQLQKKIHPSRQSRSGASSR